mmetsp:Transcript_31638/g.65283  ORF Transcript_31638/g.65283 Transcript_31638/m.65283 type:complete len:116 (-) Transcript_31638:175-522(-)
MLRMCSTFSGSAGRGRQSVFGKLNVLVSHWWMHALASELAQHRLASQLAPPQLRLGPARLAQAIQLPVLVPLCFNHHGNPRSDWLRNGTSAESWPKAKGRNQVAGAKYPVTVATP